MTDPKPRLNLTRPVTVTLSPQTVVACMNGMAELPYHIASPAIHELEQQVLAAVAQQDPAPPKGEDINVTVTLPAAPAKPTRLSSARKAGKH